MAVLALRIRQIITSSVEEGIFLSTCKKDWSMEKPNRQYAPELLVIVALGLGIVAHVGSGGNSCTLTAGKLQGAVLLCNKRPGQAWFNITKYNYSMYFNNSLIHSYPLQNQARGPIDPKNRPTTQIMSVATVTPDACEGERKHALPGRDNLQRFKNHRQM
ncbi:hypothetical protein B0J13DRAFT_522880 [Dactylonectria estremocensis]|uniref:Uncharacterized protein n=1 Tax=Dactylonectria estremocensis TaxID=1079267 RepID=A0A9P9JB75_9HYPO|nr:hypothetical protein B0J13DRAFT_522880 [Dactylonectria estremocensis]